MKRTEFAEHHTTVRRSASSCDTTPFGDIYLRAGKRTFDLVLALHMLVFAAPIMLVISLLCSLDGKSPFFSHERVGYRGRKFRCLKFRTMRTDSAQVLEQLLSSDADAAAEWAKHQKLNDDPRVTTVGRILRKTSLDELPQIFNVLMGQMSLVGPRPVTEEELLRYEGHTVKYLSLRPGMTGLWQVHGRGIVSYKERVEMDAQYFWTANFLGDLRLMLQTTMVVLDSRGQ